MAKPAGLIPTGANSALQVLALTEITEGAMKRAKRRDKDIPLVYVKPESLFFVDVVEQKGFIFTQELLGHIHPSVK